MKTQINSLQRFILSATVIGGLLLYSSCEKDKGPIVVIPNTPTVVSFSSTIQPIFNTNCVTCHSGPTAQGGLDLSTGNAYNYLVNVTSNDNGGSYNNDTLVVPGSPTRSVLWNKVDNTGVNGGIMPPKPAVLPSYDINYIKEWIQQGAKNN
ncbi:MAG: c-type cytochrome domain-containing protein [Bacteroidia bacterium]